jgi:hypothetical protein
MKWTRTFRTVGKSHLTIEDEPIYTSGDYRIERRNYTLPTRSTGYVLFYGREMRLGQFDTLAEAKEVAAEDLAERSEEGSK